MCDTFNPENSFWHNLINGRELLKLMNDHDHLQLQQLGLTTFMISRLEGEMEKYRGRDKVKKGSIALLDTAKVDKNEAVLPCHSIFGEYQRIELVGGCVDSSFLCCATKFRVEIYKQASDKDWSLQWRYNTKPSKISW